MNGIVSILLVLVLAVALTSCFGQTSKGPKPAAPPNAGPRQAQPRQGDGDRPPAPEALPAEGVLRLFGPDPLTLDPAMAQDVSSWGYLLEIQRLGLPRRRDAGRPRDRE